MRSAVWGRSISRRQGFEQRGKDVFDILFYVSCASRKDIAFDNKRKKSQLNKN